MTQFQPIKYQLNILVNDNNRDYYNKFQLNHLGDSGIDLYNDNEATVEQLEISIEPFKVGTVNFNIKCEMIDLETNTYSSYYLVPRSSISKTNFQLANSIGIIDAGYRGEIMAKIRNFDPLNKSVFPKGTFFQIVSPDLKPIKVNIVDSLSTTTRGDGGFGSTDVLQYTLYFDGCSKGNPGISGAGVVIYNNNQQKVYEKSIYVGEKITNNMAEYNGLIIGLKAANELGIKNLIIKGDSLLIIKQMNGEYKIKQNLDLYNIAFELKNKIDKTTFIHINRQFNQEADKLANEGLNLIK
jgi:ribonuclease HI/dUTPase